MTPYLIMEWSMAVMSATCAAVIAGIGLVITIALVGCAVVVVGVIVRGGDE